MAVMTSTERARCLMALLRAHPTEHPALARTDIRAALDAADSWADTNTTAFDLALPVAYRNAATSQQKALLLAYVCLRRAGLARVQEDS